MFEPELSQNTEDGLLNTAKVFIKGEPVQCDFATKIPVDVPEDFCEVNIKAEPVSERVVVTCTSTIRDVATPLEIRQEKVFIKTESFTNEADENYDFPTEPRVFKCGICSHLAEDELEFKQHLSIHRKQLDYGKYDISAKRKEELKEDMEGNLLKCTACKYTTLWRQNLMRHITKHLGKHTYKCNCCQYVTTSNIEFIKHKSRRKHFESKFECDKCGYVTTYRKNLLHHMTKHVAYETYKCEQCVYKTIKKEKFDVHVMRHAGIKPYECNLCGYTTTYKSYLDLHMKLHTPTDKPFKCEKCPFRTSKQKFLLQHNTKVHPSELSQSEKPLVCCHCRYKAVNQNDLRLHLVIHSGEELKCYHCGYSTSKQQDMQQHVLSHFDNVFNCGFCNYSTKCKLSFRKHVNKHCL